jgi:hypothetical protein
MTSIRPGISDEFLFTAGVEVLPEGIYSLPHLSKIRFRKK